MNERIPEDPDKTVPPKAETPTPSRKPLGSVETELNEIIQGAEEKERGAADRIKQALEGLYSDILSVKILKVEQDASGAIVKAEGFVKFRDGGSEIKEESFTVNM